MKTNSTTPRSNISLTVLALGIVYGDIGTSPLYAVQQTFSPDRGIALELNNIIGGISVIFWLLMFVVSLKYVTLILRANNKGEGGTMALLTLALSALKKNTLRYKLVLLAGMVGAAFFYGEIVLTPAISVLSAVEGLNESSAAFKPFVLPLAIGIVVALFLLQHHGTGAVGAVFGPVMVVWFLVIGAIGLYWIIQQPLILQALNPRFGFDFLTQHGVGPFVIFGVVILAVTGVEALYADMGHFGAKPIRTAWFGLVLPALMLNYLGQGALLLTNKSAAANPFYASFAPFSSWALYPMIALATCAAIIAAQATISGAYSLTKQAIQLGFLPRMKVMQTSAKEIGQIYIPTVNWLLFAAVIITMLAFTSSAKLTSAYGIAVTGTMLVTTLLTFIVVRFVWGYNLILCIVVTSIFFILDIIFFVSTSLKLFDGGWFPVSMGLLMLTVMLLWRQGRDNLLHALQAMGMPLKAFMDSLTQEKIQRVSGTAVYLTTTPSAVPQALLHNLKHNKVLHERIVVLTVDIQEVPWVSFDHRVEIESLGQNFWRLKLNFGFKNRPNVSKTLTELCPQHGLPFDMMNTSFFVSREILIPVSTKKSRFSTWRERMFASMARNAGSIVDYFNIPPNRVVELGTQIEFSFAPRKSILQMLRLRRRSKN